MGKEIVCFGNFFISGFLGLVIKEFRGFYRFGRRVLYCILGWLKNLVMAFIWFWFCSCVKCNWFRVVEFVLRFWRFREVR